MKVIDLGLRVRRQLTKAANPGKAPAMQAYMKSTMPYLGVVAPTVHGLCKKLFAEHQILTETVWRAQCLHIWRKAKYREERYAAIQLTGHKHYRGFQNLRALPMYEEMIVTGAWWDYVDEIASRRLGVILTRYPAGMRRKMLMWSRCDNLWKRRSAILCQLKFKQQTDLELLYTCIEPSLDSREFFLAKAIGWALRQYAWTDAQEIVRYVEAHRARLSPLSQREALKNMSKLIGSAPGSGQIPSK